MDTIIELARPFLGQGMVSGAALFLLLYYRRSERELRDELRTDINRVQKDRDSAYANVAELRASGARLRDENTELRQELTRYQFGRGGDQS